VCNYLLTLVRLNQVVPLSVYLRWSKDERRRELKERWCRAAGLRVILEPASACDPTSRAMACVEAVREKRALVMTPDLPQKREHGVAVMFKQREVYLPSGPASIAMLANVPIAPIFGRVVNGRHQIYAGDLIRVPMLKREDGGRQVSIQWATQRWAEAFERFICEQPQAWFFWGDKHWSRVWRGDPRYVQPAGTTPFPCVPVTSRALEACS
jgi:predicted LPLAT superfamily acyltransferase